MRYIGHLTRTLCLSATMVLTASFSLVAQNIQGKAYYIANSKLRNDFRDEGMSEARKAQRKERQRNLPAKNYVLAFNGQESLFTELEVVDAMASDTPERGRPPRMLLDNQNDGVYYKNVNTKQLVAQRDIFGKQFLISDSLYNFDWEFSDEVKSIGRYTCFKATATFNPKNDAFEEHEDSHKEVTAWYTIEIPASHGPRMFWGLPGLILELQTENEVLLCSKIELTTEEEIIITPPTKGKKISQTAFDELLAKKMEEVKEMHQNRRRGGRGNRG